MEYKNPVRYGGAGCLAFTLEYLLFQDVFLASYLIGNLVLHAYLVFQEDDSRSVGWALAGSFLSPAMLFYGITIWILSQISELELR